MRLGEEKKKEEEERKKQDENIMVCHITQSDHKHTVQTYTTD